MGEQLITKQQLASKLKVSKRWIDRHRPKLVAAGLQEITLGRGKRYRESQVDAEIVKAAKESRSPWNIFGG